MLTLQFKRKFVQLRYSVVIFFGLFCACANEIAVAVEFFICTKSDLIFSIVFPGLIRIGSRFVLVE